MLVSVLLGEEFHDEFITFVAHCSWHNSNHPQFSDFSGAMILLATGGTAPDVLS